MNVMFILCILYNSILRKPARCFISFLNQLFVKISYDHVSTICCIVYYYATCRRTTMEDTKKKLPENPPKIWRRNRFKLPKGVGHQDIEEMMIIALTHSTWLWWEVLGVTTSLSEWKRKSGTAMKKTFFKWRYQAKSCIKFM